LVSIWQAKNGGWNIADCVERAYDVEGMHVGTVAAGRIGLAVLRRMHPFDVKLHYADRHRLPESVEKELNLTYHENWEDMIKIVDVLTLNCPLHPETEHMMNEVHHIIFSHPFLTLFSPFSPFSPFSTFFHPFSPFFTFFHLFHLFSLSLRSCLSRTQRTLGMMKKGAYIVNIARGKLCDRDALRAACDSGDIAGYAGDVWFPQPAPVGHPWRDMPWHAMTPHTVNGWKLFKGI
jgi:formate dehydrogenase